jgi:hypothetical protein
VTTAGSPPRRLGHLDVFAAIAALSFLVARFLPVLALPYTCPARGLLGIPCATCGMTHAFVALGHGDLAGALQASPLGAGLAAGAWAFALLDLLRLALGRPVPRIPAGAIRLATGAGALALLLNWAWLLART